MPVYNTVDFRWMDASPCTGRSKKCPGVWTTVDHQVPIIIPLTCRDGRYSTIHSTYYHCYLI